MGGCVSGQAQTPVRVDAGTLNGRVAFFDVRFPWTNRDPIFPHPTDYAMTALLATVWLAPIFVAWRNWRAGRADLVGAYRIGAVAFVAGFGFRLLIAHDAVNALITRPVLWMSLGSAAWAGLLDVAFEPWGRRFWPHAMVGWARLVAGRWSDPVIARDVLVALALVLAFRCISLWLRCWQG